jgi:hypothetical protein
MDTGKTQVVFFKTRGTRVKEKEKTDADDPTNDNGLVLVVSTRLKRGIIFRC